MLQVEVTSQAGSKMILAGDVKNFCVAAERSESTLLFQYALPFVYLVRTSLPQA